MALGNRLALHAVNLLIDNLGLANLELVALATHGLDEHREVEHTTARDNPLIGRVLGQKKGPRHLTSANWLRILRPVALR